MGCFSLSRKCFTSGFLPDISLPYCSKLILEDAGSRTWLQSGIGAAQGLLWANSSSHTSFPWPLGPLHSSCGICDLRERTGKRVTYSSNAFVRLLAVFNQSCAACNQNRNCSDAERLVPDEIVTGNASSSDLVFAMCEGEKSVLVGSFIHSAFKSWNNLSLCLFN